MTDKNWTYNTALAVYLAVEQADTTFRHRFHTPSKEGELFTGIFGPQTFKLITTEGFGGWWNNGVVELWGDFPYELVEHELGHIFDTMLGDIPGDELDQGIFAQNGEFVTGKRRGFYDRGELGFKITVRQKHSTSTPYYYTQLHPRIWEPSGNTNDEEFADMFMNFLNGTFTDDIMVLPVLTG